MNSVAFLKVVGYISWSNYPAKRRLMNKARMKVALAILLALCGIAFVVAPFIMGSDFTLIIRGWIGGVLSWSMAASLGRSAKKDLLKQKEQEDGAIGRPRSPDD